MNMELDYSGAKNLEEARAIHKAYWDNIHQEVLDGKWREITREEFDRQVEEIRERNRKRKEQEGSRDSSTPPA